MNFILSLLTKWVCRHKWDKISEQILPSAYEQMEKVGGKISGPHWAYKKKFICIVTCKECGTVKKFVEVNPE